MTTVTKEKLRTVTLFEGLGDAELEELAKLATGVEIERGAVLVEESAKGSEFFAILAGRVAISLSLPSGTQSETIAVLQDGETIGESILLGRMRRIASAEAQSQVSAARWDKNALNAYFDANTHAGYVVMRNLARALQERLSSTNMMLRNTLNRVIDII